MNARRVLRHPLSHYLVLGALLFAATLARPPAVEPIRLEAAEVDALRAAWIRETGRAPRADELAASLRRHADEEMLVREALRRGYDTRDVVVRERLLRNVAFLFPDRPLRPAQALQFARELGMPQRDLVTRRRLVQLVEARLSEQAVMLASDVRTRETVERRAIEQRWFEGEHGRVRALAALDALRAGHAADSGDAFLLGARFAPLSAVQLAQRFGPAFADAAMQASAGEWIGPVRSPYGLHLLRVEHVEFTSPTPPHPYRVLAQREAQALRAGLERLRTRYPLHVAQVDP